MWDRRTQRSGGIVLTALALLVGACASTNVENYRAAPATESSPAASDRIRAERSGVRVVLGPPSVFPYVRRVRVEEDEEPEETDAEPREDRDGGGEVRLVRGQYQLYTRVRVENTGTRPVEVLWGEARLVGPDGERIRLVDSGYAASLQADAAPAAPVEQERVAPGETIFRALIPETFQDREVDAPLVPLCDQCEYTMVLPVRSGGGIETIQLPFRMETESPGRRGFRFLFWEFDG